MTTKRCASIERNVEGCPCTYEGCARRGSCCECLRYHLANRELPACAFPPDVERTWDRSFERFIKTYG